jgi:hypothetical protein
MLDKTRMVAVVLLERPLCSDCIAQKSGVSCDEVEPLLTTIGKTIGLIRVVDRCHACGRTDRVYAAFGSRA